MKDKCDKCGSTILDSKCSCGYWVNHDQKLTKIFEKAIFAYDFLCDQNSDDSPLSMDHHLGSCIILFKGDYEKCMKVKQFISEFDEENKQTREKPFYFKGKFFDDFDEFMKYSHEWTLSNVTYESFMRDWESAGKELYLNLEMRGYLENLNNGDLLNKINNVLLNFYNETDMIWEVDKKNVLK